MVIEKIEFKASGIVVTFVGGAVLRVLVDDDEDERGRDIALEYLRSPRKDQVRIYGTGQISVDEAEFARLQERRRAALQAQEIVLRMVLLANQARLQRDKRRLDQEMSR